MIFVTRLDGTELVVNAEHILTVEQTPDTVVTLTTGARHMIREAATEVVRRFVAYRRSILEGPKLIPPAEAPERAGQEG